MGTKRRVSRYYTYCKKSVGTPCETSNNAEKCANKKNSTGKKPLNTKTK